MPSSPLAVLVEWMMLDIAKKGKIAHARVWSSELVRELHI
jgi:hypothetical protein